MLAEVSDALRNAVVLNMEGIRRQSCNGVPVFIGDRDVFNDEA